MKPRGRGLPHDTTVSLLHFYSPFLLSVLISDLGFLLLWFRARLCCARLHRCFQYTSPAGCSPPTPPPHLCSHHFRVYFWLGQCHFPLCMWILEIRLSTVIVHRVEPSVIVRPERSQGFHYTGERWNKWSTDYRKKTNTRHNMSEHLLYSVYMP